MSSLVKEAKAYITANDSNGLTQFYETLKENATVDWQYLFKECYIHACLKKNMK